LRGDRLSILGDGKYGGEEALLAPVPMPGACTFMPAGSRCRIRRARGVEGRAEAPPHFRRTVEAFGFSFGGD